MILLLNKSVCSITEWHCQIGKDMKTQCALIYLCLYFAGKNIKIENIEMQSSFEEKVNIEDLLLPSVQRHSRNRQLYKNTSMYCTLEKKQTFACKHCKHGFVTKDKLKKTWNCLWTKIRFGFRLVRHFIAWNTFIVDFVVK